MRRKSISSQEMMEKSVIIQERILELQAYKESRGIALYAGFNNEVSTSLLFEDAVGKGKKVLFPRIRMSDKGLEFIQVQSLDELEFGAYGILSPPCRDGDSDSIVEAGLLVIPGVAYDLKGGRLGYGGGFYDRLLERVAVRPFVVAPAYEFQVVDDIPMHPHDVRVDAVVTEERVVICKGS